MTCAIRDNNMIHTSIIRSSCGLQQEPLQIQVPRRLGSRAGPHPSTGSHPQLDCQVAAVPLPCSMVNKACTTKCVPGVLGENKLLLWSMLWTVDENLILSPLA